tara:strand:- start:1957 stop:2862 length:906 start_codon:yes stop_codon:yes gene_type:complete
MMIMGNSFWNNKWRRDDRNNGDIAKAKSENISEVLQGLDPVGRRNLGLEVAGDSVGPGGSSNFHQMLRDGNIGRTIQLTGNEVVTLLEVSGPDDAAQLMTVTLDMPAQSGEDPVTSQPLQPPSLIDPYRLHTDLCRAQVDFGNGGFQSTAFLDFGRGVSFTVPASFVRVSASRAEQPSFIPNINVGAHIAFGSIGNSRGVQPTLTDLVDVGIGGGSIVVRNIPPFAVAVTPMFFSDDAAVATFFLEGAFKHGPALNPPFSQWRTTINADRTIAIPSGATRIELENPNATALKVALVYQLGL